MATLNIEGQSVQVDDSFLKLSPEQQNATVDEIAKSLKPSAPVTAGGLAKAAGVGAAEGAIGLAGLPGDVANLAGYKNNFGSQNIQKFLEKYTGSFYQPQNTAEKYANTVGSFLPTVAGGPETIATKLFTRAILPGVASEAAGQVAAGTPYENVARVGGALVGGAGAIKSAATKDLAAELKTGPQNSYSSLTSRNVATPIAQSELDNLAGDIRTTLNKEGIRPSVAGSAHAAIDELNTPATAGAADVADLVAARQNFKQLLGSPDANKAGAVKAIEKIDAAIERLSPGTMAELKKADQGWAAYRAVEALDKKLARADLQAAGEHSGLNVGNRIKQNLQSFVNSGQGKYLSEQNRASVEKVIRGTLPQKATRFASNLLGGGGGLGSTVLGVGAGVGGTELGHPELAALPIAGVGLRMASNRMVQRSAANAARQIASRSPYAPSMSNPSSPLAQAILRALIAAQSNGGLLSK